MGEELALGGWSVSDDLTADELCDRYGDRVQLFASMVARGSVEADDIAQEALLRALGGLHRFQKRDGGIEAWLWRIVVNVARSHGRVATRRQEIWERFRHSQATEAAPSPEEAAVSRLAEQELLLLIRSLPVRSRSAIALRYVADLPFAEVGRHLGISTPAAKMAVQRGLRTLHRQLTEEQK